MLNSAKFWRNRVFLGYHAKRSVTKGTRVRRKIVEREKRTEIAPSGEFDTEIVGENGAVCEGGREIRDNGFHPQIGPREIAVTIAFP